MSRFGFLQGFQFCEASLLKGKEANTQSLRKPRLGRDGSPIAGMTVQPQLNVVGQGRQHERQIRGSLSFSIDPDFRILGLGNNLYFTG